MAAPGRGHWPAVLTTTADPNHNPNSNHNPDPNLNPNPNPNSNPTPNQVTSRQRPLNSLLEATLDFKQATKAAPVETEEQSRSIEDIIKARVKD